MVRSVCRELSVVVDPVPGDVQGDGRGESGEPVHGGRVRAEGALHLAVARADAETGVPIRLIAPADILVEHRGEGQTARQVHHLLPPAASAERKPRTTPRKNLQTLRA